jgi:hypothetical protein
VALKANATFHEGPRTALGVDLRAAEDGRDQKGEKRDGHGCCVVFSAVVKEN